MTINHVESIRCPFNNPVDPYGPPLVRWIVRVRNVSTGRWWYIRQFRSGAPVWTSDPTYAKAYSERRSRFVQVKLLGLPMPGTY